MSSSVVFVLLIFGLIIVFNSVAINAESKNIGIKMIIPRGYTEQQYLKSIVDFWTPERMASAKPLAPMITKNYLISGFDDSQTGQIERVLTPSAPLPGTRSVHPPSAGRAFFVLGNATYVCSGSVVNAKNRAMIVTAGHCVYDTKSKQFAKNWIFVPQYDSNDRPHGTFVWREMATKEPWIQKADYNHDVAIILVHKNEDGHHVQDRTGAFGISLNAQKRSLTHAFGFPMNINNGETMSNCVDTSTNPSLLLMSSFKGLQIKCGMGGGASGGPWLQHYDSTTHSGKQISLTSFSYTFAPGKIHGPYFTDDNIGSLFLLFENQ